jgi:hypothetical protein
MSLNSRCQCDKCGCTFSLFKEETKLLPNMLISTHGKLKAKKILKTWTDWVEHLATHCQNCRIRIIPPDCLKDYDRKKLQYEQSSK